VEQVYHYFVEMAGGVDDLRSLLFDMITQHPVLLPTFTSNTENHELPLLSEIYWQGRCSTFQRGWAHPNGQRPMPAMQREKSLLEAALTMNLPVDAACSELGCSPAHVYQIRASFALAKAGKLPVLVPKAVKPATAYQRKYLVAGREVIEGLCPMLSGRKTR
jgi:hypothetical protein